MSVMDTQFCSVLILHITNVWNLNATLNLTLSHVTLNLYTEHTLILSLYFRPMNRIDKEKNFCSEIHVHGHMW